MKKPIAALFAACAAFILTGCIASPLANTITDDERADYQARCMEVRGTYSGNLPHEVPKCIVTYEYPSVPERINPSDSLEEK